MNINLSKLLSKKSRLIIGLLSGTSIDSVDAVLVRTAGNGINTRIKILGFITLPIPLKLKNAILKNSDRKTAKIEEVTKLNVIIGALFSDAVFKLLKRYKLDPRKIDLIGSHGQTIHHLPATGSYLGYKVKSTLQIGDPSIIANLTGITTIGDFRISDCAAGGDGAPLAPYLDYILFRNQSYNRALLNIGGISNITILPKDTIREKVIAFDTGPGNMLIDGAVSILFNKSYDRNGNIARKGKINKKLCDFLLKEKYYKQAPPKSTGRENYGKDFMNKLLNLARNGTGKSDFVRTITEFTVYSVWYNYDKFVKPEYKIDELFVSGGGAENPVIMEGLKKYFGNVKVRKMNNFGITAKNKEAVLFAVLANECISGNAANMKSVTGSTRDVILGKICQASSKIIK